MSSEQNFIEHFFSGILIGYTVSVDTRFFRFYKKLVY